MEDKNINEILHEWRLNLIQKSIKYISIVGSFAFVIFLLFSFKRKESSFVHFLYLGIYIVILSLNKLKFKYKSLIFIVLLYIYTIITYFRGGLLGTGRLVSIVVPILTLVLLGKKPAIISTAVSIFLIILFALLANQGFLDSFLIDKTNSTKLSTWIEYGSDSIFLIILSTVILIRFYDFLLRVINLKEDSEIELMKKNQQLESEIIKKNLLEKKLEKQASVDDLTGSLNRRAGLDLLKKFMSLAKRKNEMLSLAFIDLDNLKTINDSKGHSQGDKLLRTFVRLSNEMIRDSDVLCRLGGDEFIVIFPSCNMENAKKIVARIGNPKENLDFSSGISEYRGEENFNEEKLVQIADNKMYQNKIIKKWIKKSELSDRNGEEENENKKNCCCGKLLS